MHSVNIIRKSGTLNKSGKIHKNSAMRKGYIICNSAIVGMAIALLRNYDES